MVREVDWSKVVDDTLAEMVEDTETVLPKEASLSPAAIPLIPAFIVGGLLGGLAGKKDLDEKYNQAYANAAYRAAKEANKSINDFGPDHYTQTQNIINDLRVVFTPLSVLYIVRGVTIDNIEIREMNDEMKQAWQRRDQDYFKILFVNKMYMDIQLAEQMLAKQLVENHVNTQNQILNKKAEEVDEDADDFYDYETLNNGVAKIASMIPKSAESAPIAKYLDVVFSKVASPQDYFTLEVEVNSLRPFAELPVDLGARKLQFYSPLSKTAEYIPPSVATRNVSVVFFPDRVIYLVGNVVISQMSAMQMSDRSYTEFQRRNEDYFRHLLLTEVMEGAQPVRTTAEHTQKIAEQQAKLTKTAAQAAPPAAKVSIFTDTNIDPRVYKDLMDKHYGDGWLGWEGELLLKNVEEDFGIDTIGDIPFDKLSFIQVLFNSDAVYQGFLMLEKCIRSFNNKFIDFNQNEPNISPGEIVNALRIMVDITGDSDIYDSFSEHTFSYLVDLLAKHNVRVLYPIAESPIEDSFYSLVNIELVEAWNNLMKKNVYNDKAHETFNAINKGISDIIMESLSIYRGQFGNEVDQDKVDYVVKAVINKRGFSDEYVLNQASRNVMHNLAIDHFVAACRDRYKEQAANYVS